MVFCGKCGTEVPDGYAFCTKCGSAVPQAPLTPEPSASSEKAGAPTEPLDVIPASERGSPRAKRPWYIDAVMVFLGLSILVGVSFAVSWAVFEWRHEDVSASISSLEETASETDSKLSRLSTRVSSLESDVPSSATGQGDSLEPILRSSRIASAVTILSLVAAYGGFQRSDSPAGKACLAWLMLGDGSVTDCGFTR